MFEIAWPGHVGHVTTKDKQPAVLFDVDGTLIDSNYLHVYAWQRAFGELDMAVETWRVHRSIGMDGSTLIDEHSGSAPDEVQNRLTELRRDATDGRKIAAVAARTKVEAAVDDAVGKDKATPSRRKHLLSIEADPGMADVLAVPNETAVPVSEIGRDYDVTSVR